MLNKIRQALLQLGFPVPNANGNFEFQVTPRTDTIANLVAITDAGDGEVATATDINALVVYKGTPSVARILSLDGLLLSLYGSADKTYPTGDTAISTELAIPAWVPRDASARLRIKGMLTAFGFGFTASTAIKVRLQTKQLAVWTNIGTEINASVDAAGSANRIVFNCDEVLSGASLTNSTDVRLVFNNVGAATGTLIAARYHIECDAKAV